MPFIDDERAMELPQYSEVIPKFGTVDLSVPTKENLELNRRITQRDADLMRQVQADRSIPEKLAGGLQAGRFMGSAMLQGINAMPTRIIGKGTAAEREARADKLIEDRLYKPTQPLAYEYTQDVMDFLDKLETDYKIPPLLPEALPLQYLSGPATAQAAKAAGKGAVKAGMALERRMEPVVKGALESGGLPREMALGMGANTQSNVVKPYGGNWLGGGEQLGIPENDLRRLKRNTAGGNDPVEMLRHMHERYTPEALADMQEERRQYTLEGIAQLERDVAVNKWIDSNLKNYVKKEMGTRDDPVRKLAEEGITHMPLPEDLDRMEYLQAIRKAEGYPAEGMGKSELAKRWENLTDDSIRVTKAGKIQEAADVSERVAQARAEIDAYTKELDKNFLDRMKDHTGSEIFSLKEVEALTRMPEIQKAEILGDTRYKELKENLYQLMAREQGFEKRAGELNPFVSKLDPETRLYSGGVYNLGFDHIVDVMREDVAAGRIRPEQLNKVSMEQAVRRTYEYDQEMAKRMREAAIKQTEGFPTYKEYPEGFRWIEIAPPKELPQGYSAILDDVTSSYKVVDENGKEAFPRKPNNLGHINVPYFKTADEAIADALQRDPRLEDALKYEGDTMGHCVGGYCKDVRDGNTKIYSLRDARGEPHVTVEVSPNHPQWSKVENAFGKEIASELFTEFKTINPNYGGQSTAKIANMFNQFLATKGLDPVDYGNSIIQIKGKGNAKPKDEYIPFVQDFVKTGNWSQVGDFRNTGLRLSEDAIGAEAMQALKAQGVEIPKYVTQEEAIKMSADAMSKAGKNQPPAGMKAGGKVSISNNPDTMMLEVNNQKMKNGVPAYAGGKLIMGKALKAALPAISDAERALPLRLTRAMPKSKAEINAHAERVARQMMGEHVTSGKAGDTKNLAGRSMKESQRVKGLEYEIVPTKDVPESQVYQPQIGDINMALPGDFTLSDVELKSLQGEPVGSRQQGGSRYGLGHMEAETPLFYASNEVPAQGVQNKATDLSDLFGAERIIGQHMAMGPVATNFAQHFADANLRYTDYSKLRPQDMYEFDKIISEGFVTSKKDKKTGETIYKIVDFPDWPGVADPQSALAAMEKNPEMRKWYNRVMQTPKITEPLGFPSGQDVRYAITSPDLRDMEVNLTGHGVGRLVPNAPLTDTAQHNTYSKGIPGMYLGHQEVLTPFAISFPDAAQHIITTKNPQDFTGTIQKVFPHQRVDQQFIDEMEQYRKRIKELTGKKKGGVVKKEGGYLKKPAAYINGDEFVNAAKKYGIKDSMNNLNKIVDLVNKGLSVDDAARQVADSGMNKAAGGAIRGDDLILEERPL